MSNLKTSLIVKDSFKDIIDHYNSFIVDVWGIFHNGVTIYPESVKTLAYLKSQKKNILLLSNAPRRSQVVLQSMQEMGFPIDLIDNLLTSGEATYLALKNNINHEFGRTLFHIGPTRDLSVFEDLDYITTENIQDSDFILNTGMSSFQQTLEDYIPILEKGLSRKMLMVCANPDQVVRIGDKYPACAGALAFYYEQNGGRVIYHGKPYKPVYEMALNILENHNKTLPVNKFLCIGDSLETDIQGGKNMSYDTAWVTDHGIHAQDLGRLQNFSKRLESIMAICGKHKTYPTYCVPSFCL